MYMHRFSTSSERTLELKVGRTYQIRGYHTGDFTGKCVAIGYNAATFSVCDDGPIKRGAQIEVPLVNALGGVKIEAI